MADVSSVALVDEVGGVLIMAAAREGPASRPISQANPGRPISSPESKSDKKGPLRTDGFNLVVVPDEERIVQRI